MKQEKLNELEKIIGRDYSNTAGIQVMKNGEMLYENYFNGCSAKSTVHIYSVTKSIISALIGIAADKGLIKSVDQKVLDFFPDYTVKKREKTIQNVTLNDLLTMTAPFKYKVPPYIKYFTSDDWLRFSLDLLGGRGEIGKFQYAALIGPDILSGIIARAAGQSVFDFACENLFKPLGITVKESINFQSKEEQMAFNKATDMSGWAADPTGLNSAGWGLSLTPGDMAKIGQLYLDRGKWNGSQIISEEWIDASTREHSRWKKMDLPYGYLWWIVDEKEQACAAMGDGGNVIYFNREKNMVISILSLFVPQAKDRLELIRGYIEPIFEGIS